jgi:amidase
MNRRWFLGIAAVLTGCADRGQVPAADAPPLTSRPSAVDPATASLAQLAQAMNQGALSARHLTELYLQRIDALDRRGPTLRAVLEINPDALADATLLDRERAAGRVRGPLHGIPILIKDNIDTAGAMTTTAGSLALEGWHAPVDAPLVARLRRAGAVILGKSNLSEWANIRSAHSSSGWSGRGGQVRNPYDLARSPSGSSSGSAVAVAAGLCAAAVGSETDGSIVSPASVNGLVGIKPTVGLVSRGGMIPISSSQDTAGPMARSVADAVLLLDAMRGEDPDDAATAGSSGRVAASLAAALDTGGLRGARLGIARKLVTGNAALDRELEHIVDLLREAGAVLVDPLELPKTAALEAAELDVLLYELKAGLNRYLARLPANFRVHTIGDVIRFNRENRDREMPAFEQELFEQAEAKGPLSDAAYHHARAECLRRSRAPIDAAIRAHRLDAIVSLTGGVAWMIDDVNGDAFTGSCSTYPAVAGFPHITVPAARFHGLPLGVSFFGSAWSEEKLIRIAAGFEAARGNLPAPPTLARAI